MNFIVSFIFWKKYYNKKENSLRIILMRTTYLLIGFILTSFFLFIMKKEHKKAEKFVEYIQQTTDNIYIAINEKKRQKDNNIDGLENIAEICCF